jgi:hypothetical protein
MPKRLCYHQYCRRRMWKMHEFTNPLYVSLALRWNIVLSVCLISLLSKNPLFYLFSPLSIALLLFRSVLNCWNIDQWSLITRLSVYFCYSSGATAAELSPDSAWTKHYGAIAKMLGKRLFSLAV